MSPGDTAGAARAAPIGHSEMNDGLERCHIKRPAPVTSNCSDRRFTTDLHAFRRVQRLLSA
ncbi:hypothetical protein [Microbulbifer sp. TYP-18]|uniref:hypothetical protein n=1 Tax=Microbulbifer sp. TYP-18 TaxID=3230024 RepID=UPI0034C6C3DA